ncbi:MAG: hypothetical protein GXO11_03465 [Epsilonproteobacteria bacterium]|nr:hypothetical protein [Campylobacterota bacterium]
MQVESVLEFCLDQDIYCFNTKHIQYVFDLDRYESITGIDESVIGIVRYNDDMMLLIDTLYLYTTEKKLDLSTQKSVVVIQDEDGSLYGMLVDEIIKIEDVEVAQVSLNLSSEEIIINHYKENDKLINEIVPLPLLHVKKIPAFSNNVESFLNVENNDKEDFLLFKIQEKIFAIEALHVKEVILKEGKIFQLDIQSKQSRFNGALSIRDEVIRVANMELESQKEDVIVIEYKGDKFCIDVDEVLDIEEFDYHKIEPLLSQSNYIKAFYNFHSKVVGIVDVEYFSMKKDDRKKQKEQYKEQKSKKKEGFLIFEIGQKRFALDIEYVRQVIYTQDISKTKSSLIGLNSLTAFIATWNHYAVDVIKLDNIFDIKTVDTDSQVVIIGDDTHLKGILVDNVEEILYIQKDHISIAQSEKIIDGAILDGDKVIPKINPQKVIELS